MGDPTMPDVSGPDDQFGDGQFEISDVNYELGLAISALSDGDYAGAIKCLDKCDQQISGENDFDLDKFSEFKLLFEDMRDDLDAETLTALDKVLASIEGRLSVGE